MKEKIAQLIERLEGDSSGPTYDDLTIFAASLDAAQALRVQQAEIERLDKCLEQQLEVNFKLAEIIEELKDQIETWECDNYNRQIGGE